MAKIPSDNRTAEYKEGISRIIADTYLAQSDKFIRAAQELSADESEEAFEAKLKRLGKLKPEKEPKK